MGTTNLPPQASRRARIISALLTLLGFSATGCKVMYGPADPTPVMYGVLSAYFVVKGAVTDPDGKPVDGIRVVLKQKKDENDDYLKSLRDTVYSKKGLFETNRKPEHPSSVWVLVASDVDGAENGGEFATSEEKLPPNVTDFWQWDPEKSVLTGQVDFKLERVAEKE